MSERLDPDTLVLVGTSVFHRREVTREGWEYCACSDRLHGDTLPVGYLMSSPHWRPKPACRRKPCFPHGVHID